MDTLKCSGMIQLALLEPVFFFLKENSPIMLNFV